MLASKRLIQSEVRQRVSWTPDRAVCTTVYVHILLFHGAEQFFILMNDISLRFYAD
jgi:hypothetical protein